MPFQASCSDHRPRSIFKPINIAAVLTGTLSSVSFVISEVFDAGTEVNDFTTSAPPIPSSGLLNSLGLPASNPPAGAVQNGLIAVASGTDFTGFLNVGVADVSGLDFSNYSSIAAITVSAVPVPAALPLLLAGLGALGTVGARRQRAK